MARVIAPGVGVVVLNWNNLEDTLDCLASVSASKYPALSVMLVDNHSVEDPCATVAARFPRVHIARQRRNLGYSGGNNIGIAWALEASADYVLLLNNDTVVAVDIIERLVEIAERHVDAGFVTPRILVHGTDRIYWDGGTIDWATGDVAHDSSSLVSVREGVRESAWSNGCAPLIRAKTIREIGLMDDELFLYYEDLDWSARATKAGWRHLVALDAICGHKVSRSSGGTTTPLAQYYYARNRYRVLARHASGYASFGGALRYARRIVVDYRTNRADVPMRQAILQGALDLVRRKWGERQRWNPIFLSVCDALAYGLSSSTLLKIWRVARRVASLVRDK